MPGPLLVGCTSTWLQVEAGTGELGRNPRAGDIAALGCRGCTHHSLGPRTAAAAPGQGREQDSAPWLQSPAMPLPGWGVCGSFGVRRGWGSVRGLRGRRCSPGAGAGTRFYVQFGAGRSGGAEGAGGFPQRGLNVLKYSAYKRGQEFPAQTAREEETARPSCRPWHPPPGISAPGFLMPKKLRLLANEGSGKFNPRSAPRRSRGPRPALMGAGCQLRRCPGLQTRPLALPLG